MDGEKLLMIIVRILTWACIIIWAWCLLGCAHGPEYRLYRHDAARELFIRDMKNKDVLTYEQAHGLICFRPEDVKKSLNKEPGEGDGRK